MELKKLVLVKNSRGTEVMSEQKFENMKRWRDLEMIEELGVLWPKNATVEMKSEGGGRCWVWAKYEISASEPLNEQDMQIIRAQYDFLTGQKTADVNLKSFKEENGKFVYEAFSECDSSD